MTTELRSGTRLGRYEIRSHLGAGGMGEVYLAHDTQLDRTVAIKILPGDFAKERQRMQRFIQEAKSASALNHPNILTIYEIGETDQLHFIATEFIDGETIRERIRSTRVKLSEVLDIASQVASALAKAHQSGIVHRDIKPENIMINRDGYVKVLDFGLAKLAEHKLGSDSEAPTMAQINTEPGKVMGTTRYMSPEQARGFDIDARTDIWSLGVMIYEMLTGVAPFEGSTNSDLIVSILEREPPPIARFLPDAPNQLERIIRKALAKDREDRYQVIKDLQIDLRNLKRELELEAEIDRTVPPEMRAAASTHSDFHTTLGKSTGSTHPGQTGGTASSAEYIVNEIKRHKTLALIGLGAVLLVAVGLIWFNGRRTTALTDKDTILLADFVNTTGDQVFDGTLKQALAVQLAQSPFLSVFADDRIRETLRFMGKSTEDRVTRDVGREICQRQGIKALLAGTIANIGNTFVVTLEAVNAQSGEVFAREQVEAAGKEQVLKSLGTAASRIRERLGESLGSIQKFDAPIEQATTSSLEALKAFSMGDENRTKGAYAEAIPFYRRATEIDPNFAIAFARLSVMYFNLREFEPASEFSQKAFELRERVSERERFYISTRYYQDVLGDLEKARESLELWKRTYTRDYVPVNNLSVNYSLTGEYDKQEQFARECMAMVPNNASPYTNLGFSYLARNRFDEAKTTFEQALDKKLDSPVMHFGLYQIAFIKGDASGMQRELEWAKGKAVESTMLEAQANTMLMAGKMASATDRFKVAIDLALQRNQKELAARYYLELASAKALFGNCEQAKADVQSARGVSQARSNIGVAAFILGFCGDTTQAQKISDDLAQKFSKDSFVNFVFVPLVRATLAMKRNDFSEALRILESCRRYEMGAPIVMWPAYVRALIYLEAARAVGPGGSRGRGAQVDDAATKAAAEFQNILDHPGVALGIAFYPLSHVGLARAAAAKGDTAGARKSYQDFLAMWKDGDGNISILQQARMEYEKLK